MLTNSPLSRSRFPLRRAPHRQRGVSLLEVLVAVVVLSIGLLGLAGLQLSAMRNNQSSAERSNAVMLTYSILEAMRASRDSVRGNAFNIDYDDPDPEGGFAAQQVAGWRALLEDQLGEGANGAIACVTEAEPVENSVCTITIRWNDSLGLGGSSTQTFTTEVRL